MARKKRKQEKQMPSLAEMLDRKNMTTDIFEDYCDNFLSVVVGVSEWKEKAHRDLISKFVTPSDEAFALVSLENSYDRWLAEANAKDDGNAEVANWPERQFTNKMEGNGRKFQGWSQEGLTRYKTHMDLVKRLRKVPQGMQGDVRDEHKKNKDLEEEYRRTKLETNQARKRRRDVYEQPTYEMTDDESDLEDLKNEIEAFGEAV